MATIGDDAGSMKVSALVGDPVARIAATATLQEVAAALTTNDIGLLVVGEDDRPGAVVSERDVVRALAAGRDPSSTRAGDVAHTELVWCDAEASVDAVAREAMDRYVRHVLVEADGRLVGVVSARDLLGVYALDAPDDPAG